MRRWTLGGISRLWSPQKSKADEAVPTPSPLADHHPNRIQKPRDRTPKTYSRKGTARAQKLAARLGTSSELEEVRDGQPAGIY